MLIGGVVENKVHDDADVPLFGFADQLIHILHGAVHFIDLIIIGNVIAVVRLGRAVDRREPDRADPEGLEVIKLRGHAL